MVAIIRTKSRGEVMRLDEEKKKHENIALVIDKDLTTRSMIKKCLAGVCRVIEIMPSDKLLAVYQQYVPNIVFIDQETTIIDGKDMIAEIMAYDKDAFIVTLNRESTQSALLEAKQRGAKGFITKPFNRDTLIKYINLCDTIKLVPAKAGPLRTVAPVLKANTGA